MDKRKEELFTQFNVLKVECFNMIKHLEGFLKECSLRITDIQNLDRKSFRQHSNYFIRVLHFQSFALQKIIDWNMDWEMFLSESRPPVLEHFEAPDNLTSSLVYSERSFPLYNHANDDAESCSTNRSHSKASAVITQSESDLMFAGLNVDLSSTNTANKEVVKCSKTESITHTPHNDQAIDEPTEAVTRVIAENAAPIKRVPTTNQETLPYESNDEQGNTSGSENFFSSLSVDEMGSQTSDKPVESIIFEKDLQAAAEVESFKNLEAPLVRAIKFHLNLRPRKSSNERDVDGAAKLTPEKAPAQAVKVEENKIDRFEAPSLCSSYIYDSFNNYYESKRLPKVIMPDIALRPASECSKSSSYKTEQSTLTEENLFVFNANATQKNLYSNKTIEKANTKQESKGNFNFTIIPEAESPKIGDTCAIMYVISPAEIYLCCNMDNFQRMAEMSQDIAMYINDAVTTWSSKTHLKAKLKDLQFCSYYFRSNWWRAEIIDWMNNSSVVTIQLIDYGIKLEVPFADVQLLPPELYTKPRLVNLCNLAYLYPPGSTEKQKLTTWLEDELDDFFEVLGEIDTVIYEVVACGYSLKRKSYEIDLLRTDEADAERTIGQILIENKDAVEIFDSNVEVAQNTMKRQILAAQGLDNVQGLSRDEILEQYFRDNLDKEPENVGDAVMHYDARDEAETCINLRPDGTCYKGKSCPWKHTHLTSGFTTDRHLICFKAFEDAVLPIVGDNVDLKILHVTDIRSFYAVFLPSEENLRLPLDELHEKMNHQKITREYKPLKYCPSHGELVVAKYWNGNWYRAQVRDASITENGRGTVEIFLVDYGESLKVSLTDLRKITSEFLKLPFQAVECRLYNVKHKAGADAQEEVLYFRERYLGQIFTAEIISIPGHLEVLLQTGRGEDLGLEMIGAGYGDLNKEHLFPSDSERFLLE